MIVSSQGYVFVQEYGDSLTPDLLVQTVKDAGYRHHDHMIPLANLIEKGSAESERYFRKWSEAFGDAGIELVTSYAGLSNHERFVIRHEPELRKTMVHVKKHFPSLRTVTTNPDPLPNGQMKDQTMLQAEAEDLACFAGILSEYGVSLSLHFHTPELRDDARELHYLMQRLDPEVIKLTFDVNWCLRGGYSITRMLDEYQARIDVVHLRSSTDGVWDPVLRSGDEKLDQVLARLWADDSPRIHVIELANEAGTNPALELAERLRVSREQLEAWSQSFERSATH
jgi:sugar phosphate isomerase/epimerase